MMKLLILLAVAVAGVPAAHGQDSLPAVKGRVTDASTGADIDFADVVIVDTSNRTVAGQRSSAAGNSGSTKWRTAIFY